MRPFNLPLGFRYATTYAGIHKQEKDDLSLIVSGVPAAAAAVFRPTECKPHPSIWRAPTCARQKACAGRYSSMQAMRTARRRQEQSCRKHDEGPCQTAETAAEPGAARLHQFGEFSEDEVFIRSTPITPVEAGSTWLGCSFSSLARALVVFAATLSPVFVAQFALPALTSIAPHTPFDARMLERASLTGAACILLVVNTAAAAAGTPETIRERSSFSCLRMPAYVVAYLKPNGRSKGLMLQVGRSM